MDGFTGEPMSIAPEDDGSVLWPSLFFVHLFLFCGQERKL